VFKRYTDTDKWDDPWFCDLSPENRSIWQYLCDKCDNAGMYKVNVPLLEFQTKINLNKESFFQAINLGKYRLMNLEKYWLLTGFVKFQFGELGAKSNLHNSVRGLLAEHGLEVIQGITMASSCTKVSTKVKVSTTEEREKPKPDSKFDQLESFNENWELYPAKGRLKRSASLRVWCEIAVSRDIASRLQKSIKNYTEHLKANGWKNPQEFPNFLQSWTDWENHKEENPHKKPEKKPNLDCTACGGTGELEKGKRCWCWK